MPVAEPRFKISSFCHAGGCVAVALGGDGVLVRSSRETGGPVLAFGPGEWSGFVDGLRDTAHDPARLVESSP